MSKVLNNLKELYDIAWKLESSEDTKSSITKKIIECVPDAIREIDFHENLKYQNDNPPIKEVIIKHKYIPWPDYYCPCCDAMIQNPYFVDGYMPNHCFNCGQLIRKPSIKYPLE